LKLALQTCELGQVFLISVCL